MTLTLLNVSFSFVLFADRFCDAISNRFWGWRCQDLAQQTGAKYPDMSVHLETCTNEEQAHPIVDSATI